MSPPTSSDARIYCYTEVTVFFNSGTDIVAAVHGGMARLSWPEWP